MSDTSWRTRREHEVLPDVADPGLGRDGPPVLDHVLLDHGPQLCCVFGVVGPLLEVHGGFQVVPLQESAASNTLRHEAHGLSDKKHWVSIRFV